MCGPIEVANLPSASHLAAMVPWGGTRMRFEPHPHRGFLASYETGILNHVDNLEPVFNDHGILDRVTTCLSIGIGAGNLECQLVQKHGMRLSYVEPSDLMADAIHETIARHGIAANIDEEIFSTFEEASFKKSYDLILSLDSWYRIGCNRQSFEKALRLRAPHGRLLVQLLTREKQIYWALDESRNLIAAEELSSWALSEGFEHEYIEQMHKTPCSRLISDVSQPTKGFEEFVSFAVGQHWQDLNEIERRKAIRAVHDLEQDGCIETYYGFMLFRR